MPYPISIFISHSWHYSDHYDKIAEWLFQTQWNVSGEPIVISNTSIPEDNPIHFAPNEEILRQAIYKRIQQSHIVVIPSGMYASYSKWIQKEIDGAKVYRRPILAVDPFGSERRPGVVMDAANEAVGWQKQSVVNGVWNLFNSHYR